MNRDSDSLPRWMSFCRWQDLLWLWMLSWQRVWVFLPFQVFLVYPLGDLGVDLTKLLLLESTNTRIAWHLMPWTTWFDLLFIVDCSDRTIAPSTLSHWTSLTAATLPIDWIVFKSCIFCCFCIVVCCVFCRCIIVCFVLLKKDSETKFMCKKKNFLKFKDEKRTF